MKLKVFLAACAIALAACATTGQNGPLATEANVVEGLNAAYAIGKALNDAGALSDDQATEAITAIRSIALSLQAYEAAMAAGNSAGAAVYLQSAASALQALSAQLAAIQAAKK